MHFRLKNYIYHGVLLCSKSYKYTFIHFHEYLNIKIFANYISIKISLINSIIKKEMYNFLCHLNERWFPVYSVISMSRLLWKSNKLHNFTHKKDIKGKKKLLNRLFHLLNDDKLSTFAIFKRRRDIKGNKDLLNSLFHLLNDDGLSTFAIFKRRKVKVIKNLYQL